MANPHEEHELPRVLNVSHATSIVVGIIIGSGIFLVPREMIAAVGSSGMVYAVWISGGLLSLFGAMTYAEIAAARPHYGGEYAFLREAYGDLTGFLYMWTFILDCKARVLSDDCGWIDAGAGDVCDLQLLCEACDRRTALEPVLRDRRGVGDYGFEHCEHT